MDSSPSFGEGDYQLALVTPGINPADAISLKVRRDKLNFLKKPRARPVSLQRLRKRIGDVSLGILFKATRASCRSFSVRFRSEALFLIS